MDYPTLLQNYPGYQGWGQSEALADFAATGGSGKGGSSGGGATTAPTSLNLSSVPSVQGFEQQLGGQEDTALQNLITQMEGRQMPLDIYQEFEQQAGLPELRDTAKTLTQEIANVEDVLEGIEPQIAATTRESLVTEGQRRGMVQAAREPQLERLEKFSTNLGRISNLIQLANQGVLDKTQFAMEGQKMGLEPYQLAFSALVDRNSRRMSAFTQDRQTMLDEIYAKWERQNQLSDMEWQLANELAQSENEYMRNLQIAAAELGGAITGGESIDDLLGMIAQKSESRYQEQLTASRSKSGGKTGEEIDAEKAGITGEYISSIQGAGSREAALQYYNAYKSVMEKEGADSQAVRNAIDTFYPEESETSSSLNLGSQVRALPEWLRGLNMGTQEEQRMGLEAYR